MIINPYRFGVSSVGTYWNPTDTDSKINLSGGNAVATRSATSSGTWCATRSITSHNSGKWYAECGDTTDVASAMMFGIGTAATSLATFPGGLATSWGIHANNSTGVRTYTNSVSSIPGLTQIGAGGYARIAVDFATGRIWLGVSTSATWAGGGDPAAGTTPTYTFAAGTTLYLMLGESTTGQVCTLKNHVGENTGTIPTGFSMWG
jgi:hypothetical protein